MSHKKGIVWYLLAGDEQAEPLRNLLQTITGATVHLPGERNGEPGPVGIVPSALENLVDPRKEREKEDKRVKKIKRIQRYTNDWATLDSDRKVVVIFHNDGKDRKNLYEKLCKTLNNWLWGKKLIRRPNLVFLPCVPCGAVEAWLLASMESSKWKTGREKKSDDITDPKARLKEVEGLRTEREFTQRRIEISRGLKNTTRAKSHSRSFKAFCEKVDLVKECKNPC